MRVWHHARDSRLCRFCWPGIPASMHACAWRVLVCLPPYDIGTGAQLSCEDGREYAVVGHQAFVSSGGA